MRSLLAARRVVAVLVAMLLAGILTAGCDAMIAPPPVNLAQFQAQRNALPPRTILLHNLQRVMDPQLPTPQRLESLEVVQRVGGLDDGQAQRLAGLAGEAQCPQTLRVALLDWLGDQPAAAGMSGAAGVAPSSPAERAAPPGSPAGTGDWQARRSAPAQGGDLSQLVNQWAAIRPADPGSDVRFRGAIEQAAGRPWDKALLDAMNQGEFAAAGEAMELLSRQVPPEQLKAAIRTMAARTQTVGVLQGYLRLYDYLPATAGDFERSFRFYRQDSDGLDAARRLTTIWGRHYGYRFDVRDAHLLIGLARDHGLSGRTRGDLRAQLASALIPRRHSPQELSDQFDGPDPSMRFDLLVDRLSMVDLWNLTLLDAMLARAEIRSGLAEMARRDLADRSVVLGGLVFLEAGRAEARLYPASRGTADAYVPSASAVQDEPNSLCRFWGRFDGLDHSARAGPTQRDLDEAGRANFHALVLTGLGGQRFCAHYLNPTGLVVSLGQFEFPPVQRRDEHIQGQTP